MHIALRAEWKVCQSNDFLLTSELCDNNACHRHLNTTYNQCHTFSLFCNSQLDPLVYIETNLSILWGENKANWSQLEVVHSFYHSLEYVFPFQLVKFKKGEYRCLRNVCQPCIPNRMESKDLHSPIFSVLGTVGC